MSFISTRLVGVIAAAAIAAIPLAVATPAAAATKPAVRSTTAMVFATWVGNMIEADAHTYKLDGRSTKIARISIGIVHDADGLMGPAAEHMTLSGLSDRNHDGLDDDAKLSLRFLNNDATVTLHKSAAPSVTDGGFVFKNRRSVLKESAQAFDRFLLLAAQSGADKWDMRLIKAIQVEMPGNVRVVSDYDGNRDGYDDDGRLTFLAGGKAVTLTIGNTAKQVGKITYGPTWKTRAPKRTHKPSAPPIGRRA